MIWPAPEHGRGDRVLYDGREWLVTHAVFHPYYYVELHATDGSGDFRDHVHMSHLTMSWCPVSHGGKGQPPALRFADYARPCGHERCHDPIERGERYAVITVGHARQAFHLECAQIQTGQAIDAPAGA